MLYVFVSGLTLTLRGKHMLEANHELNSPRESADSLSAFLAGSIQSTYAGLKLPGATPEIAEILQGDSDDTGGDCCHHSQSSVTNGDCTDCCDASALRPCVTNEPGCTEQAGCHWPETKHPHHCHHHHHQHASWYDRV
jgi:hypothetical protein